MDQMKEQNKTPGNELNKMGQAEFKTLVIRILSELSENFNSIKKVMETIKNIQSEIKDTLTEMKNNLQGINSTVDETENQISD